MVRASPALVPLDDMHRTTGETLEMECGVVLAAAGVIGAGLPLVAFLIALACAWGFRRTVAGR